MSDVLINLDAREQAAIRAFQNIERATDRIARGMDSVNRRTRQGRSQLQAWGNQIKGVALGYLGITQTLSLISAANRQIIEESAQIGAKVDEQNRKFRVQSGLRGLQADAATKRIEKIAEAVPLSDDPRAAAFAAATQLVSSGFSAEEASGGSLRAFSEVIAASNLAGRDTDPRELAQALASFLNSQNLALNEANVRSVGGGLQSLFRGTNIQVADLAEFAKEGASFAGKLSVPEQLGAFSALRQAMPAGESSTGLRNIVSRLGTARTQKKKVDALKEMGLSPDDVDLIGENLDTVLGRLSSGLAKLRAEEREGALKTLFEEKGVSVAKLLIAGRNAVAFGAKRAQNLAGFDEDVQEATSGRVAAARRQTLRKEVRRAETDTEDDLLLAELTEQAERDANPAQVAIRRGFFQGARFFGVDRDTAAGLAFDTVADRNVDERARAGLEQRKGSADVQRVEVVNQNREQVAKKRPAAAVGR